MPHYANLKTARGKFNLNPLKGLIQDKIKQMAANFTLAGHHPFC